MSQITKLSLQIVTELFELAKKNPKIIILSKNDYRLNGVELIKENGYQHEGKYFDDDRNLIYKVKELASRDDIDLILVVGSDDEVKGVDNLFTCKKTATGAQNIKPHKSSNNDKRCFIATAVFDSPYANEVIILREFRDNWLLTFRLGEAFVNFYYWASPPIANQIAKRKILKEITKSILIIPLIKFANILKRKEK
jgi:hypothetical protein